MSDFIHSMHRALKDHKCEGEQCSQLGFIEKGEKYLLVQKRIHSKYWHKTRFCISCKTKMNVELTETKKHTPNLIYHTIHATENIQKGQLCTVVVNMKKGKSTVRLMRQDDGNAEGA